MANMLCLILLAVMASLTLATESCSCFTAHETSTHLFCGGVRRQLPQPDGMCMGTTTMTTVTHSAVNPTCTSTSTEQHTRLCCGRAIQLTTEVVTADWTCEPTGKPAETDVPTATSWVTITITPTAQLGVEKAEAACRETTLFGGQDTITTTVCDEPQVCSVCVGCNAPVTVCNHPNKRDEIDTPTPRPTSWATSIVTPTPRLGVEKHVTTCREVTLAGGKHPVTGTVCD